MLLDGLIASAAPRGAACRRRAGCGRSCSCTCRSATAHRRRGPGARARGPGGGRRGRHHQRLDAPPAGGAVRAARRADARGPSPASTPRASRPGTAAGGALLCVAAVTPGKGHDVLLDGARDGDATCRGAAPASAAWTGDPAFADGVRRRARSGGLADRVRFAGPRTGAGARPRVRRRRPARARLARRDLRHGRHRGAGARRCRSSPPTSAAWPRRSGTARTGAARAAGRRPATRRPSAPRCGPGSATPSCARACAGPRGSGARRCAGWPDDRRRRVAGVLAGAAR